MSHIVAVSVWVTYIPNPDSFAQGLDDGRNLMHPNVKKMAGELTRQLYR